MKITLLTSSRADLGIQTPLLNALAGDPFFEVSVIAFGAHSDPRFGSTILEVRAAFSGNIVELQPVLEGDGPADITLAMARTMEQFHAVWRDRSTDMIIALGDRYEMFAAVAAALPFGIPVTHLHGGETTKGAIDNALRHSITHMARMHFTCAEPYRQRVVQLLGADDHVYDTGALSVDNLRTLDLLSIPAIRERFGLDLSVPTALITFHPETAGTDAMDTQWMEFSAALKKIAERYRLLVTLPNADTKGLQLRSKWMDLLRSTPAATGVDSLGSLGYLSCMKHAAFLLGNSSSGYVEASFFPKWVIDVGERQTGRIESPHLIRCPIMASAILDAVARTEHEQIPTFKVPYGDGHAADRMVNLLKSFS
jgi:GDP/UDP-N,N'-diacetylbacillosamine 2-epimerase (hydrolysing)